MVDKTVTIKSATDKELDSLLIRLRKERELQSIISDIQRRSTPRDQYDVDTSYNPPVISTEQPIEALYHKNVEDTLAHYGILGMKWGVRRKQGSNGLVGSKGKTKGQSEDFLSSREIRAKGYKNMSDAELKKLTNRLNLEKQLRDLNTSDYTRGLDIVKGITAAGTTIASLYALSETPMGKAVKKAITDAMGPKQMSII